MALPAGADWIFGGVAVICALWALVRSVHVKIKVKVRKLTPDEAAAQHDGPDFSFEKQIRVEHGEPVHFGTRPSLPK